MPLARDGISMVAMVLMTYGDARITLHSIISGPSQGFGREKPPAPVCRRELHDPKAAIDRYFEDRNANFQQHPKRAGKKTWGNEREPAAFSDANTVRISVIDS